MGRLIGSVLLGYLALAMLVFAGLSLAYLALGADRAFRPGVFEVSMMWGLISLAVGFVAAIAGGWVARRLAGRATGPRVLAAVVVALGLLLALAAEPGAPTGTTPRVGPVGNTEAMQMARTPLWLMILNPLVGAVGVLVGGKALDGPRAVARS